MSVKEIKSGVYLVIDPSMNLDLLFLRLESALQETISAVQIWDHWNADVEKRIVIEKVCELCHLRQVAVIINNDWKMLKEFPLDGIHFDTIPVNLLEIRETLKKECIMGITCNNNLTTVQWATENKLDYISFCSVFPSATSNSCELVSFDTIHKAREITSLPIFLAGGIRHDNMIKLKGLDFDGVAVISGIMNQEEPQKSVKKYVEQFRHLS